MNPFRDEVMRHVQAIAIGHSAWHGPIVFLAETVARSMNTDRMGEIETALRATPLQRELFERDIALWIGNDGYVRLVDQSPSSLAAARLRTEHHPGVGVCRFCLLREAQRLIPELEAERDARDELIPGSFIHPQCRRAWRRLRSQVERIEEITA